jgi:glycosyltransferase involved in cell wall biosynthesis
MRIVQLIPTLSVGGAERIVALLAREQMRLGHAVDIVVLGASEDSWIEQELRSLEIPVHFLDKGAGLSVAVVPKLGATLRALGPDVVHTHLHVLKYLLPTRTIFRPSALVHTLHNLAENEAVWTDRTLQQGVFRWRVAPVAIGDAVAQSLQQVYGLTARATIPNGIEVDRFAPAPEVRPQLRAELGLPEHAPVFVVVGRLNPQKNHRLLMQAFGQLRGDAHLLVVGDGELRAELEALAPADRVRFLGIRKDVPRLLAAADVFVLSSDWEGNPLVVMEAMAAGKPVVATAVGCVPELVVSGAGRLVPSGDAEQLAAAMQHFIDHPEAVEEAGRQALDHARRRFDVSAMAASYIELYEQLRAESSTVRKVARAFTGR